MYRIIKNDGTEIGITDSVNYIKISESGSYTTASKDDAIGVAYRSVPYNLIGHTDIDNADTVCIVPIDGGAEVYGIVNTINILLGVAE